MSCTRWLTSSFLLCPQVAIKGASKALYSTLENRAYWGSVTILLPNNWPDTCAPNSNSVVASQGETADFTVGPSHPVHGDSMWTQQSRGCGQSGDFVYISHRALLDPKDLSEYWSWFLQPAQIDVIRVLFLGKFVRVRQSGHKECSYNNNTKWKLVFSAGLNLKFRLLNMSIGHCFALWIIERLEFPFCWTRQGKLVIFIKLCSYITL